MANNFDKTNVGFESSMLRSDLCEAYVLVEGRISVTDTNNSNRRNEKLHFGNNVIRQKCKTKIIGRIPADKNRLGQEVCFHIKISE